MLGSGAGVSVVNSSSISGVWSFSSGTWARGSGWTLPLNVNVPMVLDTGLTSNATLHATELYVLTSGSIQGFVGFPIY
jgi:hypothetical protein